MTRSRTYLLATAGALSPASTDEKASWLDQLSKACSLEISTQPPPSQSEGENDEDIKMQGWLQKMVKRSQNKNKIRHL